MDYMSIAEAALRWGVSKRRVYKFLEDGRVAGAKHFGSAWMIPASAEKPLDPRKTKNLPQNTLTADLAEVVAATTMPMPSHDPDRILDLVSSERLRVQYEAELAYLRGNYKLAFNCYRKVTVNPVDKLRISSLAIAVAISTGDYPIYAEIEGYLKSLIQSEESEVITTFAEQALSTASVSTLAPNMAPDWLKRGDYSKVLPQALPDAFYKRAKFYQCLEEFEAMLAVAQTALSTHTMKEGISLPGIYLRIMCIVASCALGREAEAKTLLLDALHAYLPHGFLTPFAESATSFGGLLEQCLLQEFPTHYEAVLKQWKMVFGNWIVFHNRFTKDNLTQILSLREYHIALLVAQRVSYADIAERHSISVGRLKNIVQEIYRKLLISNRSELRDCIIWTQKT